MTGIFALTLAADGKSPFPVESDEVKIEGAGKDEKKDGEGKAEEKGGKKEGDEAAKPVRIDFEGLASRVTRVPIEADNIGGLAATDKFLVYSVAGPAYYGRE